MKNLLTRQLFYACPVLFCFVLPFGGPILSLIIIAWIFLSFFNINQSSLKRALFKKQSSILILFFILTCLSALYSSNQKEAITCIEIKLSFIIFPWLLFYFEYPVQILKKCLISFVSGCFFASLILLIRSTIYAVQGHPEYYFYTLFSDFIHASYFSMYLIFAITIVLVFYHHWFSSQKEMKYISIFFVSIFILCIFLCSSKLGLISLFLCLPIIAIYRNRQFLKMKYLLGLCLGILLVVFVSSKIFPNSFQRLQSITSLDLTHIDKSAKESTAVRVLIWKEAARLISQKPLLGHGVGDANDQLFLAYETNGITGALKYRLNAHNQYLQTFIGMGLAGILIIIYLTWFQIVVALKQRKVILLIFAFLVSLNFLVESMLQTAAGVLFFVFFFCFTHLISEKDFMHA